MPFVKAHSVNVNFPFEPYSCQISYMEKVVKCLKEGQNGILESPTGTGKTLCLLCSSLAWLEDKKAQITSHRWKMADQGHREGGAVEYYEIANKEQLANQLDEAAGNWNGELGAPRIIYASRTHSQLAQAVQELKRTAYRHLKVCVLGSREQLCIHPHVMKEESNTAKVHLCRAKTSSRFCHFYNNVDACKSHFMNQPLDIEDLVTLGKKHNSCPYYSARELKNEADIIFMPYNYLLDPKSRRAHGVELQGNIVIFDEAHNLEKICEDSTSFDFTSTDLAAAIQDLAELSSKIQDLVGEEGMDDMLGDSQTSVLPDFTLREVFELKAQLHELEKQIDSIPLPNPEAGVTKPGSFIFELFAGVQLTFFKKGAVLELIDKIVSHLTNDAGSGMFHRKGTGLSKYADVIKIVFSREPEEQASISHHQRAVSKHYKVHIREETANTRRGRKDVSWGNTAQQQKTGRTLSYWCFSPGHAMQELKAHGVRTIILTSGTLAPLESFTTEMGIPFPVQLENPHVIEKHQVWIGIVGKGPDGTLLNSSYQNRFKETYQASMGNAVVNFARVVPNGLLLFFPSYPVMNKCLENWQSNNIWHRVEQYKQVYVEPRGKADFHTAMENFYEKINDTTLNGAIFAAVCRGKVSEGLDFSDINGRAVVITGLPFPPRMDPKVMLKMQFLDEMKRQDPKGLSGQLWYRQQATRAVNQAIGRVIRHKNDYGAIILCDNRFESSESRAQLPSWVRPNVGVYNNFGSAIKDINIFFKTAEKLLPAPNPSKKKVRAGQPGGQTAYFMPTIGRSAAGPVEQASSVAMHVPSLKAPSASSSLSDARLKIQYEPDPGTQKSTEKSRGLLSALSSTQVHDIQDDDCLTESQVPSYQKMLKKSQLSQAPTQKKKIIVKSRGGGITTDHLQSAEQYLAEVKKTLSSGTYTLFSQTLTSYKKTQDFTAMVAVLADLFTGDPRNYPLFRKFYRFVRPQHKEQFDHICRDITGQGCGFKPEDAIPKKRNMLDTARSQQAEKRRKMEGAAKTVSMDTKSTEKTQPVLENQAQHLDSHTHLPNAASETSSGHCDKQSDNHTAKSSKSNSCPLEENSVLSKEKSFTERKQTLTQAKSSQERTQSSVSDKVPSTEPFSFSQSTNAQVKSGQMQDCSQFSSPVGNRSPLVDSSQLQVVPSSGPSDCDLSLPSAGSQGNDGGGMTLEEYIKRGVTGHTCCSCKKDAYIPLKAPCDHICCMECWKNCIRETKQCPACRQKVKRKHLSRIFFPCGPNKGT